MLTKLYGYLAAAGALVVAVLAALGMARRSGVKAERDARTEKALEQSKESNDIAQANRNLSDADAAAKLRGDQRD